MNDRRPERAMDLVSILSVFLALAAGPAAAVTNVAERWPGVQTEGWLNADLLSGSPVTLTNSANALYFAFGGQSMPAPNVSLVYAPGGASGGRFIGNYILDGVENVQFRMYCAQAVPGEVRLYFGNTRDADWWYYPVAMPKTGEWVTVDVPLEYDAGWLLDTAPTHLEFIEDLRAVSWIGIRILRNGSTAAQPISIDDFVLASCANPASGTLPDVWVQRYFGGPGVLVPAGTVQPSVDSDSDGLRNYAEYLAGTDPTNEYSILAMNVSTQQMAGVTGLLVDWNSVTNRAYVLWRSSDLTKGFVLLDRGIPSTPPRNTYNDTTATNAGPYFYRVGVEF